MNNGRLPNQPRLIECETRLQPLLGSYDVSWLINKKVRLITEFTCPGSLPLIRTADFDFLGDDVIEFATGGRGRHERLEVS